MNYGYDGKHLFSFDGEFKYLGIAEPPEGVASGEDEMAARMTGSYFISGNRAPALNVWSDGEGAVIAMTYVKDGEIVHGNAGDGGVAHHVPICLSGPVVYDGEKVAEFCRVYAHSSVFVCPVVQELAALGMSCRGSKTFRAHMAWENDENYDGLECQEYDPKLDGDGLGRMASVVSTVGFAVNQMMKPIGVSGFYGRTLFRDWDKNRPPCFIVQEHSMDKYFPAEPISSKHYAATSVPVVMDSTPEFQEATKCTENRVAVLSANDFLRGLPDFMRFYQLLSGMDWVSFSDENAVSGFKVCKRVPVFRYNRAYMVPIDRYFE